MVDDLMRAVTPEETAVHLEALDARGYCRVEGLMTRATVARVRMLVDGLWARLAGVRYDGLPADRTASDRLVFNLQARDKLFVDLLVDPLLKRVLMAKLNDPYYGPLPPEAPNYILGYYNARSSGPAPVRLHIDSIIPAPGERTWAVQVVFALDDQGRANGCSVVVPGSHRSGRYTDRASTEVVALEARAGDVVIWDSRLWHGALGNASGASRWALIATLQMWWIKQKMDITRSLPDEIYRALTDEQKQLLGFLSIPPRDERDGIQTKRGYEALKATVADYR